MRVRKLYFCKIIYPIYILINMDNAKNIYRQEIKKISQQLKIIQRIDNLNSKLREYNWIFLHPYNQGYEIGIFEKLITIPNKDIEEKIFARFARKFLDLSGTITMVDGYYRKRPFLNDFIQQIEESVILCLQKDFSGAISLLIPTIEGTIRNYLTSKKGITAKNIIKMSDLIIAFEYMTDDYTETIEQYFINENNHQLKYLDMNQKEQILKKYKEYFSLWIKQLKEYLSNNLYLDTRKGNLKDNFNRHNIFHGFGNINYNFKNYLKLINCINFLSWSLGMITKECSILADINEGDLRKKWIEYYKILIISESMNEIKSNIYGYEIESFKKYLDKVFLKPLVISEFFHKQLLKLNDKFLNKTK